MKLRLLSIIFIFIFCFAACKKDFLERYPQSEISPQAFFNNEKDLELYTNSFYDYLPEGDTYTSEFGSDNVNISGQNELVVGNRIVPTDASSAGWNWSQLYNINYFLDQYNKASIPLEVRNHYAGIAKFFRAYFYFKHVQRFGDVPWYGKPLNVKDPELYKARDSRTLIIDSIKADLEFASKNLRSAKSVGRVNKWAALALKSRVLLFEGTFRKYHVNLNLQASANALLQESADAANELINSKQYKLATGAVESTYLNLFASQTANNDEYILARLYSLDVNKSHASNQIFLSATRGNPGLTKSLINSYLLSNGKPISSLPNWDKMTFLQEIQNRDPRLSQTIRTPGYRRIGASPTSAPLVPDYGNALTGYQSIKYVSTTDQDGPASYTPLPIFRYAEVLLNYAEALAELNKLTQSEVDKSINLLRARVGMPGLSVLGLTADPILLSESRHVTDPLLLEVRRERRVELVMEGFRYYDLMRWREGVLLEKVFYGAYFPGKGLFDLDGDGKNDVAIVDNKPAKPVAGVQYLILLPSKKLSEDDKGYIVVHAAINKKFDESKDYLFPLPTNELLLNPGLKQNPNW